MTPNQQKLIDAAAEAYGAALVKGAANPYIPALEAAVTVALKEAAKMAKTAWLTTPHGSIADADAMNDMCEDLSSAISSLIPAQETLNDQG